MKNKKLRVLMIGPFDKTGGVANHTRALVEIMGKDKNLKLTTYDMSPQSRIKFIQNVKKYFSRKTLLKLYLKKNVKQFDIIHTQSSGGMPAFWTAQTVSSLKKELNVKFIMTFHYSATQEFVLIHKKEIENVLQVLDHLIVVSNLQKEIFNKEFPWFKPITVLPNGFNNSVFKQMDMVKCRKELGIDTKKKVIINIGNLEEYKGQKYLILAMKKIIKQNKNIVAYIVGKGQLKSELEHQILKNNLSDHVILAGGNKPQNEMPKWINSGDIFVLPSLAEGNPTVMFEAIACGKPFVGTRVGGIPEIINNDKLGILVEPKNEKELIVALQSAFNINWNNNYITDFSRQFTWKNITEKTIEVYNALLKEK